MIKGVNVSLVWWEVAFVGPLGFTDSRALSENRRGHHDRTSVGSLLPPPAPSCLSVYLGVILVSNKSFLIE